MRVLNVNSILDPVTGGGTAERTLQMSRFMRKAGIDCRVLTTDIGLTADVVRSEEGLPITALPCLNRRFRIPWCTGRRIRQMVESADMVHLMDHWTILNALVYRAARQMGKPYVVCPAGALPIFGRSGVIKKAYNRLVGYDLIRNASGHVAITSLEACQFEPYGIDKARVTVIPNGVDCAAGDDRNDATFRKKFGLGEKPIILFLGRINSIKGPDLLLQAFLNAPELLRGYQLVFAGPDGGMLPTLKEMAAKAGAGERVRFLGYVGGTDKRWAYAAAEVVVIPSRQEAMSIVALEAGAAGTPVILTDQCGFDELAGSGGGMVVAATAEALTAGLQRMLNNRKELSAVGGRLKAYVEENFGWDRVVEKYMDLYGNLVMRHAAGH